MEGSAKKEIPFYVPDGILDFSLGLGTIGFTEFWDEAVIREEILKLGIPGVLIGANCLFDDDLFYVVVEDLFGDSPKIFEGVYVALD